MARNRTWVRDTDSRTTTCQQTFQFSKNPPAQPALGHRITCTCLESSLHVYIILPLVHPGVLATYHQAFVSNAREMPPVPLGVLCSNAVAILPLSIRMPTIALAQRFYNVAVQYFSSQDPLLASLHSRHMHVPFLAYPKPER